jgi:uncharacterized membrane protein YeiH
VSIAAAVAASVTASASAAAAAFTDSGSVMATSGIETGSIEAIVTSLVPSIVASILPSGATTTTPVEVAPLFLPVGFEVAAIFAGALSGALAAVNRRFDVTGVLVLALVNGLGGGIMRDLLLQDYGIFAFESPHALYAVLTAAMVGMFFFSVGERLRPVLMGVDAFSLALFALVGADKALVADLGALSAILLGTITASGGGVIRDLLQNREPALLRRGSLYATAAIVGSAVYVTAAAWLNITKPVAMIAAAVIALMLRFGSLWLGWESPEPVDLTPVVVGVPRRVWRRLRQQTPTPEDPRDEH